jgi:RNA polymerase sigma-70 factor (ECF subfamily)
VLTVAQRDVLVLRVLVGLSVAETAQVVGRSPGAVRVLQRRAVLALRKEISKQGVTK